METSDSHSEPVKLISEIIPIKSLSVSQSVFQKKPEFKERYCELLYDEETEQKTLDIYKIKSQKKKVLFISHQILSSTKFMMDDTDGRFQLVLDSLPTIIFLFPSHNMRNRWIKAINLKPSIEELSKGSKEIEQEPSVKVDANNPVQIDTSVHNLSRANSSSATELQPIIKAFRSSSSESLLKVNTIEEKLKAQKLEDIEKNSPVTEVKQEDSSYGPSGRALSLQNQIGEISSRPRRPSRKESSAVDSVSLVLQPPGTLKLYSAPEEKTEDEPKAKPDALQSSLQPLNSLTKPELHPFSMHENDVPAPAVIVQKTTTDSSFSKDEIVVKRASSLKNVRSPNDNTNKQGSPRSTYDYQPTNTSIRSPLQMSELVSSDKPISAFNRHKPDSSPSSGQKHSNPSNLNLLKSEIEALSAMNDELNAALERSEQLRQEEVTASFNEISRLRLVLEEAMIQKTHLEEENATVITLEEQLRQLKEKNELMTIAYESLNKEYEKLQHGYKSSVEIQQQLLKEKTEIVEFNKQQKEASENLQNEIYISQNKQQELIIQLVSLTKQNESLLEENQNLHNLFQQQTRTIESLESSANQLQLVQTSNYDLNELINYQKEQIHLLQSEVANKKLDSEARTRTEESNKLTIQRLEHLINEQQQFIQDISNQLSSYKQYKQLYDESQLETIQAKDDLQKALLEKKQLQQEIDRLLIQVQYHEHEKKQKVIQYDELYANKQKDQHQLKEQLHTLQMEYDHLQNENTILQRRIELQKEQQAKFKNDEEINQRRYLLELQSLQTQITTYKESIEHANHNAYDLQKKLQGSEEEKLNIIHDLQVRLNQAEDVQSIQKKTIHDMNQRMHQLDTTIQSQQEQILKEKQMYHILQEESLLKEESWKSEKLSFLQDLQIQKDSLEDLKLRLSLKEKELFGSEHQRRESQDTLAKLLEDQRIQTHQIQQLYQELKEDYTKLVHETKNEKHVLEDRISSLNTIQHNLEIKLQELESHSTSTITEKNINIQLLSKQLNEFEIQTIEQTTKINELIAQLKSYELQTIEERKKNESLTRLFSDLQDQYTSSIKEKDLAQQNLFILEEAKVQQEKKSCREIELLQQQLQHRSKELQETQELLQEKEVLYSTRIQSLEETILSHVQIVKEKTSNLQSLEMNIKEKHLEIQQAQSAIRQTEKQAQELAEQHHQLSLSIIEKDKVLQEKERQIQELKSLFQQKVEKLNIYESQILPDHQQILQERQSDIERLNLQIEALKHDNHQLNQSNQLAEQQILSLNQSIHTLEQDLILQNQQIEKSKLFTEELQRQLTNSLKSIKTLEETNRDEIQHWNRHIQEIEQKFLSDKENDRKEIQQLNNDLRAKDMNIITLKQENNHLTNKLQNTEELLQIAQEKINDMVLKDIMNKEMDKLHKENHDVTAQLLQTKDLLQKKELQYTNLEQRFSHQKQEIVEKLLQLCEDFELFPSTDATKGNEESFLPKVFESLLEEKQEFQNFFKDLKTIFPPSSNSPSFLDNGNGRRKSVKVLVEEVENKKTGNEKENDKQIIPDIRTYIKQIIEEASERSNLQQQFIQQSFQQYPGSIIGRSGKNKASVDQAVENLRSSLSKIHHSIHQHLQDSQYNYKQLLEEYKSLSEQFHSLNSTIEQQESQLKRNSEVIQTLKDQKQLSEERHQQEIELLQKDLNQSFADYESLQEDHQKYIVLLNNNWEEKLQQQLSNVRYQADEKYLLLEKKREEDIKDKDQHLIITKENYLKQITVLQNNYEEVKHQDQQHQKLLQKLSIENTSFQEENEALLNELQLKDSQLNEVTNQLQLLEYQMAKENREKLLIERNFRKTLMMKEKQPYAPSATSAQPAFSNVREDRPSVPSVIPVVKSHHPVSHYRYRDQSPPTSPTPPPNPITNEPSLSRASSFYDRGVPFRSTDVEERTPENNQKSSKDLMKGLIERLSPKATLEDELRTSRAERASISPKRERMYPKKVEGLRIIKDRILDQDPDSRPSSSPPNRRSRRVEPDSGKLSDRQVIQTSRMKNQLRSELAYMKDGKQSLGEDKTTTNSRNEVRQGKFRTTSKPLENNHNQDESEEDDDDLMEVRSFSSHGGKDTFFAITEANNHHQTKDFPQHREISKDAEKEESEEEESSDDDYLPETKKSLPLKKEINNTNNLEKSKNNAYALRAQLQTNKSSVGRERDSEEDDEETYEDDFHSTNRASSRQPASQYRSKPSNCSLLSTALREKERGFAENEDDDDDGEYMKGKPKSTKALATSMNQRLTLKDLL